MNGYSLLWVLLKAVICGHGSAKVYFDTEARRFKYHLAEVGSAYCEPIVWMEGWHITLHEDRN